MQDADNTSQQANVRLCSTNSDDGDYRQSVNLTTRKRQERSTREPMRITQQEQAIGSFRFTQNYSSPWLKSECFPMCKMLL